MCGIVGFKEYVSNFMEVLERNSQRGGYSFGCVMFDSGADVIKARHDRWKDLIKDVKFPFFAQFRAPTTGEQDEFRWDENYPLIFEKDGYDVYVFGNCVTNDEWFKRVKDEDNNNDIYYIGKNVLNRGWSYLSEIEGVFALVFVFAKGNRVERVIMARNTYPLYYNEVFYSSVKFEGQKPLRNGIVYDWWNDEVIDEFEPWDVPYLLEEVFG